MSITAVIRTTVRGAEVRQLHFDVERYLAAVETFRLEGCEPVWAVEAEPAGRAELSAPFLMRRASTGSLFET